MRVLRALRELGVPRRGRLLRRRPRASAGACSPTRPTASARRPRPRATCAARRSSSWRGEIGADAIHPGYGFLVGERRLRPRAAARAGVVFIGPPPEAIAAMGSKIESRRADDRRPGCRWCPGVEDAARPTSRQRAGRPPTIGYPVMLKASAGGGGKGMRLVRAARTSSPPPTERRAPRRRRASATTPSTSRSSSIDPRHVEIQILGDQHGKVVSLGERECSLQRRHQKVVEEAPSPVVDAELRRADGRGGGARRPRRSATPTPAPCEFLLDRDGELLLPGDEHPPAGRAPGHRDGHRPRPGGRRRSRIAEGEPLGPEVGRRRAARPRHRGAALRRGSVPRLRALARARSSSCAGPRGRGCATTPGSTRAPRSSIHYDPMLAKLIVWGRDREQALRPSRPRPRRAAGRGDPHHRAALPGAAGRSPTSAPAASTSACSIASSRPASCAPVAGLRPRRSAADRRGHRALRARTAVGPLPASPTVVATVRPGGVPDAAEVGARWS